jgi:hypothetical protein
MKKIIEKFILSFGVTCSYSGNTKTMYINSKNTEIEDLVIKKFGFGIPFKISTNA